MNVIRYNVQPNFIPDTMTAIADALECRLQRIDYKADWAWIVTTEPGAVHVSVKWPVIDVTDGKPGFVVSAGQTFQLHDELQEEYLFWAAYELIKYAELHELREWFKVDGIKVYDPHATHAQPPAIPELPQDSPAEP